MHRRLFYLGLSTLAVACGAPVINQADLKVISEGRTIAFDNEFRYDISKENDLPRPKPGSFRGLLKGTYTARYDDGTGSYFANDQACVIYGTNLDSGTKFLAPGGVWISKTSPPTFRLYWIAGKLGPPLTPVPIDSEPICGAVSPAVADSGAKFGDLDPAALTSMVRNAAPRASPGAAGVGAGVAAGIVSATAEYERGKIVLMPPPVQGTAIVGAFR